MIFEFKDVITQIDFPKVSDKKNIAAYISSSDFEKFHTVFNLNKTAYEKLNHDDKHFRSGTECCNDYYYGTLTMIEPDINNSFENKLAFYIRKNLVLIIEKSDFSHTICEKFYESAERFQDCEFSPERFFSAFIDSLISSDNRGLEVIELEINNIEDRIIRENEYKNFYEELLKYKRKLLKLRNYYEQIIDIGESLMKNENIIFNEENLFYFRNFIRKSERLCSDVNILRENVVQLREIHQTSLDMKLNLTMKLFTVITAVFSPLTLIAGWYGMNFRYMPELNWRYGYPFVISMSAVTVIVCIYIFKKKKLI